MRRTWFALAIAATVAAIPMAPCAPVGARDASAETTRSSAPRWSPRSLTESDIQIDDAPAKGLLALWTRGDRSPKAAAKLAATPGMRAFHAFLSEQFACATTVAEFERALANPDSGVCGFGLSPAYGKRDELEDLLRELRKRGKGLRERIASRAARYLPLEPRWDPIRIRLGFASQLTFDAVTLDASTVHDSLPVILVNLTDVLLYARTSKERADVLENVLAHETFHAALKPIQNESPGWQAFRMRGTNALTHIADVMLNEGVAHYIDWQGRAGSDTLFSEAPGAREKFAFSQLTRACRRLSQRAGSSNELMEVLQMASMGPMWSKYGAVSGMFAASRIEKAMGRDALIRAVAAGPPEFLRLYKEAGAGKSPQAVALPAELITLF